MKNLAGALLIFNTKVENIKKDAENPFFKSNYASLSNILDAIKMPLIESGLTFMQFPTGSNGLRTILIHAESGESIEDTYEMRPTKDDPQGRGSTITYQRRYALASILGLNIDDDDDGNEGSKPATKGNATPRPASELPDKPWLNPGTPEWDKALLAIKSGKTLEDAKKVYAISKKNQEQLISDSKK